MLYDLILTLDGRVSRRRYLVFLVGAYLAAWALVPIFGLAMASFPADGRRQAPEFANVPKVPPLVGDALIIIGFAGFVTLLVVSFSFGVRRFHDMNLSGHWSWLVVLVAVIPLPAVPNWGFPAPPTPPTSSLLILQAVLLLVPGTKGRNRYGTSETADLADVFDGDPLDGPGAKPSA